PQVYLPEPNAEDPVFQVTDGSAPVDMEWNLDVHDPADGASTRVRASHAEVEGSVDLQSLGLRSSATGYATENAGWFFTYQDWDGVQRWAQIRVTPGAGDEHTTYQWITTSVADGVNLDPQICLDSG